LNVILHTDLIDAHFYIFSKWVLKVLEGYQNRITRYYNFYVIYR
jgi:hypothetical protein